MLSDQVLKNAMYVVGEDRAARNLAMEFADGDARAATRGASNPTQEQPRPSCAARTAARGSRATWARRSWSRARLSNDPLERFVARVRVARPGQGARVPQGRGRRLLARGQAMVVPEQGNLCPFSRSRPRRARGRSRTAAALGRLVAPDEDHDDVTSTRCSTRRPSASRRSRRSRRPAAAARATCASRPPSASSPTTLTASPSTRWSRPRCTTALRAAQRRGARGRGVTLSQD